MKVKCDFRFFYVFISLLFFQCTSDREVYIEYWKNSDGTKTDKVKVSISSKNNMIDGYAYVYYSNGQLHSKSYYEENRLLKIVYVFDTLGRPLNFGKLDKKGNGYVIQYSNISGVRLYSGRITNGRKEGWWKTYYENGKTKDSIFYIDGSRKNLPNLKDILY